MPKHKYCPECEQNLPVTAFNRDRSRADGLQCRCRGCTKKRRPPKAVEAARSLARYLADPAEANEKCRAHYGKHRDRHLKRMVAYRKAKPEVHRAAVKNWRAAHPEQVSANNHAYRARKRSAEGRFTAAEWLERLEQYGGRCAYCGTQENITKHHVVPLAVGGSNWISNVVPACGSCNSRIGDKIVQPEAGHVESL